MREIQENNRKPRWVIRHSSAVWPETYACAQSNSSWSGSRGQLFRPGTLGPRLTKETPTHDGIERIKFNPYAGNYAAYYTGMQEGDT